MIKNAKGQYYAVKCEMLEESNKVFSLCGYNTIRNYYYELRKLEIKE